MKIASIEKHHRYTVK